MSKQRICHTCKDISNRISDIEFELTFNKNKWSVKFQI